MPLVKLLCDKGAPVSPRDRWGGTALCDALREGHRHAAVALLAYGALAEEDESVLCTQLNLLVRRGDADFLKVLFEHGVSVNLSDADGRSPLHAAVEASSAAALVQMLLQAGAKADRANRWGLTPLQEAERLGVAHLTQLLR